MVTHIAYDESVIPEMVADIRTHYKGPFQFGAPDVVVVNVTKDAIWTRRAALPDAANPTRLSARDAMDLFDLSLTNTKVRFPKTKHTVADVQEPFIHEQEIDPRKYYPADVCREPNRVFPDGLTIELVEMIGKKLVEKVKSRIGKLKDKLGLGDEPD